MTWVWPKLSWRISFLELTAKQDVTDKEQPFYAILGCFPYQKDMKIRIYNHCSGLFFSSRAVSSQTLQLCPPSAGMRNKLYSVHQWQNTSSVDLAFWILKPAAGIWGVCAMAGHALQSAEGGAIMLPQSNEFGRIWAAHPCFFLQPCCRTQPPLGLETSGFCPQNERLTRSRKELWEEESNQAKNGITQ